MSKAHRGKGIRELFAHGRGVCPVCGATGIKLLYEQDAGDQKVKVCKFCKAAIKHGKKTVPAVSAPAAAASE
jgi:RNA polymerase subunit RPABC4/transcription elongation factor Spt4